MSVPQMDGEPFLEAFSSTGPFEGVPDDVELEDIPAKKDLYTVHMHSDDCVDESDPAAAASPISRTPKTPATPGRWPTSRPRHRMNSHGAT